MVFTRRNKNKYSAISDNSVDYYVIYTDGMGCSVYINNVFKCRQKNLNDAEDFCKEYDESKKK